MAYSSLDPTTGAPEFADADAPDPAVNPSQVAAFAAQVGTRLIGTTAERTAYAYAREGLAWFDTTLEQPFVHNGSGWVFGDGSSDAAAVTLGSGFATIDFTLTVTRRAGLGVLHGRVARTSGSGSSVGTIPAGFRPSVGIRAFVASLDAANTDGARFHVSVNTDGTISLTHQSGSPAWTVNSWLPFNIVFPV